jgi:hypothetical protein
VQAAVSPDRSLCSFAASRTHSALK